MKTFNDLIFEPHPLGGIIAHLFFDNGRGISVVCGSWFYSNGVHMKLPFLMKKEI